MAQATVDQSRPEEVNITDGREHPTVAEPHDRQVKDVRAQAVGEEVADGCVAGQRVHSKELGSGHSRRAGHPLTDGLCVRRACRPLEQRGEDHVATVAIREVGVGHELLRVAVQSCQVPGGPVERVHGHAHRVVEPVEVGVLVEVVADARAMLQQVANGHAPVDQRQLVAE